MIERMNSIKNTIDKLHQLVSEVPKRIKQLSDAELNQKPSPKKWSKKEILGHLCDSCFNNLQRAIRVQYEEKPFLIYDQDEWVLNQKYQERKPDEILELWITLHKQFMYVLENFDESKLESLVDVGAEITASFMINDYLDHQNHHLRQIFS